MREVFIVLPSQGMDSLSLDGTPQDCQEILTAWTAAYHPEVLRRTRKTANPMYGLYIYEEPMDTILITPKPTQDILDSYWVERAEGRNCTFLRDCGSVHSLVTEIIRCLDEDAAKDAENEKNTAEIKDSETKKDEISEEDENSEKDGGPVENTEFAEDTQTAVNTQETEDTQTAKNTNTTEDAAVSESSEECGKLLSNNVENTDPKMPQIPDFLAFGMMHLLSELMAYKLQYMSYLDDFSFKKSLLAALDACAAGDAETAHREMQTSWDQLIQSRQYYAPQDGFLFDLTLLDAEYLPESFEKEVENASHMNLLASADVVELMAQKYPQMLAALKKAMGAGNVCLTGGEFSETELPLLTQDGIIRRLQFGLKKYEQYLDGKRPEFFGRRRYGLTPLLPNILKRLGFSGALHFTLDDGRFPTTEQSRIAWKGPDNISIEAISRIPTDAQNTDAVASLPVKIAGSLNVDNAFGAIFAHWAGENTTSSWYELLKRSCRWSPIFGSLSTFSECLDATKYSSTDEKFPADRYISPYLTQAAAENTVDPISRWTRYHQLRTRLEAVRSLENMNALLAGNAGTSGNASTSSTSTASAGGNSAGGSSAEALLQKLEERSDSLKDFYNTAWQEMLTLERAAAEKITAALSDGTRKNALLLLNPWSFTVARTTDLSDAEKLLSVSKLVPPEEGCVKRHFWEKNATNSKKPVHAAFSEVPAMGFAFLRDESEAGISGAARVFGASGRSGIPGNTGENTAFAGEKKSHSWFSFGFGKKKGDVLPPPVYKDAETGMWIMTNEHLMLRFDAYTGHLRAAYDNEHRGNRFSQQLAMRLKSVPFDSLAEETPEEYSLMAADSFKTAIYADRSELEVCGRLMNRRGEILAHFTQTTTLRRGSSVVEFDVYLEPKREPGKNPWQSYYASRLAWGDPTVDLYRSIGLTKLPTSAKKIEAPYFVDVRPIHYTATTRIVSSVTHELAQRVKGQELRSENFLPERSAETEYSPQRLTLLSNGLPWHRSLGNSRLDTLLVVRGETSRRFRFAVAVNTPYPTSTALQFMAPVVSIPAALKKDSSSPCSGWLGHVSHRNVVVTHWEAIPDGVKIRFTETEGRKTKVTFQTLYPAVNAYQTDFLGEKINTFPIEDGKTAFEITGFGTMEICIKFK